VLRVLFCQPSAETLLETTLRSGATELRSGQTVRWDTLGAQSRVVLRLPAPAAAMAEAARAAVAAF
jgi:hypothetical protein